jgi:hypothetical protein
MPLRSKNKTDNNIYEKIRQLNEEIENFVKNEILTEKFKGKIKNLLKKEIGKSDIKKLDISEIISKVIEKIFTKDIIFKIEEKVLELTDKYKNEKIYNDDFIAERIYLSVLKKISDNLEPEFSILSTKTRMRLRNTISTVFLNKSKLFQHVYNRIYFIVFQVLSDILKENRILNVSYYSTNKKTISEFELVNKILIRFIGYVLLFSNQIETLRFKTYVRSGFRKGLSQEIFTQYNRTCGISKDVYLKFISKENESNDDTFVFYNEKITNLIEENGFKRLEPDFLQNLRLITFINKGGQNVEQTR